MASRSAKGRPARARALPQLLAALALAGLVGGLAFAHHLRGPARAPEAAAADAQADAPPPVAWVDPAVARRLGVPEWVDPRWLERVDAVLAEEDPFTLGEAAPLERIAARLGELSFVERVERCSADQGGLVLELALREPVACIPVGGEYALVDEDGVVLEGRWPLPPRLGRVFLPVLGPLDDALFARARAGDWLVEPEHTDALDVALSMARHVGEDARAALGRIVIDASDSRRASVTNPGVRLELEGERVALFGRAPSSMEPGELEPEAKWRALARALELYERDPAALDWELVDLRWDRPDLALRGASALAEAQREPVRVAARAEPEPPARGSARSGRPASERDDSRPRVR